jgi:hypothetical protein
MAALDQATALENELAGLRAAHVLVVGERDGLRRRVHQLLAQRGPLEGCDDCHGWSDCQCADGRTDPTDCTCPPQGGDS